MSLFSWIADGPNRRNVKGLSKILEKVNALEEKYKSFTDDELRACTEDFKNRYSRGETLDDLLPEAYSVVREAADRVLKMRHFDVQIMGGIALHQGRIAEMRTGEGKTLVSTLPAYLNALSGKGVHIVTVNEYLAQRDAAWMGKIHRFLGLTVGVVISDMTFEAKKAAYNCDIIYATNSELGFDYLRDNMVVKLENKVQRDLNFAIIDEVDSILIDEARTPLIISGRGGESSDMYIRANKFVKSLKEDDYEINEEKKTVVLTDSGAEKAAREFNIDDLDNYENADINHHILQALKAHHLFKKDSNYVVVDGEVIIVDEFTGRYMIGRRYSDGLHQAIEAKENVKINSENQTIATITLQNYFRLYKKISGMTGTAKTEEGEFQTIYNLDVVTIPTHLPMIRVDEDDKIYTTMAGKLRNVVKEIKECHEKGQPVLVGTVTVEKSEELSRMLDNEKIPHSVLNAKNHAKEAEIVAQAGKKGSVTVATNMAGRGTDILLGGNAEFMTKQKLLELNYPAEAVEACTSFQHTEDPDILAAKEKYAELYDKYKEKTEKDKKEVISLGGLRIIGTERHESRRIDNQLRGRAGRQGDPGSSVFYISMEDDVLRIFGSDRMKSLAQYFKIDEDTPISAKVMTRQIEQAQKRIENHNFIIRKHVLEYDDVNNKQREVIYSERNKILNNETVHDEIVDLIPEFVHNVIEEAIDPDKSFDKQDVETLNEAIQKNLMPAVPDFVTQKKLDNWDKEYFINKLIDKTVEAYEEKIAEHKERGIDFYEHEKVTFLKAIDINWIQHLDNMDALREGVSLRGVGQQDPVVAYKKEAYDIFEEMIATIQETVIKHLLIVRAEVRVERQQVAKEAGTNEKHDPVKKVKIGRNDPCPCGSGKKYKQCCGRNKNAV